MPLDAEAAKAAAADLIRARRDFEKLDSLPEAYRPVTMADGYAVQDHVVSHLLSEAGARRVGYKIGATNPAARSMLGAEEPFAASLISTVCHAAPLAIRAAEYHVIVLEPEIAVRLAQDLPARDVPWTAESAAAAVDGVAPAIEVVTSPFPVWNEAGIGCIIGDNGANGCWVHGAFTSDFTPEGLAEQDVTLAINGLVEREGAGRNVDGGPMVVLAWLANFMIARGEMLRAGDLVTTGSTTQPIPATAGQNVLADFGALGDCALRIE